MFYINIFKNLQEELDRALIQRQARETGICPVREQLYNECFGIYLLYFIMYFNFYYVFYLDELIRHVTISCAERGFLLVRVRNELRMRVAAYQTLYESSIAFGLRKALQAELGRTEQEEKVFFNCFFSTFYTLNVLYINIYLYL